VRVPWETDGSSAVHVGPGAHPQVVVHKSNGERVTGEAEELVARRDRVLDRQVRLFGDGHGGPGLFSIGPHPDLVGREVDGLVAAGAGDSTFELYGSTRYDPDGPVLPMRIAGELEGVAGSEDVAVAVNGRVAAVTRSFSFLGDTLISALLPESAFRPGQNRVRVYLVRESGAGLRLEAAAPLAAG
jgi:hypothetical protein